MKLFCIGLVLGFAAFQTHVLARMHSNNPSKNNGYKGSDWKTLSGHPTKIIGHRGEKVLMPEHTLGSYEIAAIEQVDFVEPDLVLTKDEQLICFHDLTLRNTTDVAHVKELAYLEGLTVEGDWYIPDLTLAQIKILLVEQREIGIRPQYFNRLFQIPTFEEFLQLVQFMTHKLNVSIGIIPELKHPEILNKRLGKPYFMENEILRILAKYGYPLKSGDSASCETANGESVPCGLVVLQSFNKKSLQYLRNHTTIELMMLVEDEPLLLTVKGLKEISAFAHYYTVWKEILVSGVEAVLAYKQVSYNATEVKEMGGFIGKEDFLPLVHDRGMELGLYTIYDSREPSDRGCAVQCLPQNKTQEVFYFFEKGVDAIFTENIQEARELRIQYDFIIQMKLGSSASPITHSFLWITIFGICLSLFIYM